MRCKNCQCNFRTIHIPDNKDRVCYKCGFNNGKKEEDIKKQIEENNKKALENELQFLSNYYNKVKTNKSKLIEDRLDYLRQKLNQEKEK